MNAQEKEDLRHAVLESLAARHPAALTAEQVSNRAWKGLDFSLPRADGLAAVESALTMLKDLGFVTVQQDGLGSSRYWSATAAGVLLIERGETNTARHD